MTELQPPFQLPNAERFSRYLEERLGEGLRVEGPTGVGFNIRYEEWKLFQGTQLLGIYQCDFQYGGSGGKREVIILRCFYEGRIPGYKNDAIARAKARPEKCVAEISEEQVRLDWGCSGIDGAKRRRDFHHQIPFP